MPSPTRPWKEELKDLFVMHKGERTGFAVLLVLCLLSAAWVTYEQWIRPRSLPDQPALEVEWAELQASMAAADRPPEERSIALFAFDPNGLPVEQWVALGLTARQAEAIHRYEEHGGRFRSKRDLARMRVVDPGLFVRWEPYIELPDSAFKRDPGAGPERSDRQWDHGGDRNDRSDRSGGPGWGRTTARVEVNTADSVQLVELPGIGPSFAKGILKYRDRLGGFVRLDQLDEVRVLRDRPEALRRVKELVVVDTLHVRRFPLNTFTAEELGPHPYAGWKLAKALVAYRKQHGPFRQVADIKGCVLVNDSIYQRLVPYLTLE